MFTKQQIVGLRKRLAALQADGVSTAPTVVGNDIQFKKKGTFRVYGVKAVWDFTGTAAAFRKEMKKKESGWCIVQRLAGLPRESAEWVSLSTRDPRTGENTPVGEFWDGDGWRSLSAYEGDVDSLKELCRAVEGVLKDVMRVEVLRATPKAPLQVVAVYPVVRTVGAALAFVRDLVEEGILTEEEALLRISPTDVASMETPTLDALPDDAVAKGTPAAPGVAIGPAAWSADEALKRYAEKGDRSVLVVKMTSPEDVSALRFCAGIVTERGGLTSHAAVVARGMGLPCVVSAEGIGQRRGESLTLSMDGSTGYVYEGATSLTTLAGTAVLDEVLRWVEPGLQVHANVDTPEAAQDAVSAYGARGIGLCRTEHQFFGKERIEPFRRMLMADTDAIRKAALIRLLEFQRADFQGIFEEADGLPVTIRLLDAPLHEFWGEDAGTELGASKAAVKRYIETLQEANPMLGHRGCRLGITAPEVYAMQTQAVAEAAKKVEGARPKIMVPLVASVRELIALRALVEDILEKVLGKKAARAVPIGTMIETPRACLTADEIAHHADFMSFGTNDLTQMVWGFSRDDVEKWMPRYLDLRVLQADPFATLDVRGVGRLIRLGIELARAVRPDIEVGVCGEHAADPKSIAAFAHLGVDYISCSPSRLKMARLAAAQVTVRGKVACESV